MTRWPRPAGRTAVAQPRFADRDRTARHQAPPLGKEAAWCGLRAGVQGAAARRGVRQPHDRRPRSETRWDGHAGSGRKGNREPCRVRWSGTASRRASHRRCGRAPSSGSGRRRCWVRRSRDRRPGGGARWGRLGAGPPAAGHHGLRRGGAALDPTAEPPVRGGSSLPGTLGVAPGEPGAAAAACGARAGALQVGVRAPG